MQNLMRILPILAVVTVLGGAIYYVQSQAPQRHQPVETAKAQPASQNLLPTSDRYANAPAVDR
jgi:hypothetical protein